MPKKNTANSLFDLEQVERDQVASNIHLTESTKKMLMGMMQLGCNKIIVSSMLEMAGVPNPFIQYLEGPVITHRCGWMDSIPPWVFNAVYVERLELIFKELEQGKPGTLATAAEVMACIYPASMEAPLMSHWADTYFWCGSVVIPRHRPDWCPSAQHFWNHIGQSNPIPFSRVKQDFEYIGRDIREKVIKHAPKPVPQGKSAPVKPEPPASEPETVQIDLFDLL